MCDFLLYQENCCVYLIGCFILYMYVIMTLQLDNFVMNSYEDIKPYFDELLAREVNSKEETLQWLADSDDLSAHISEDGSWRYIHNSCDTKDEEYKNAIIVYNTQIAPKLQEVGDLINKKIISLP